MKQEKNQQAYESRVSHFVSLLHKGKNIESARLTSHVGTRISRAAASLQMTNLGTPTRYVKSLSVEKATQELIKESNRIRLSYEKRGIDYGNSKKKLVVTNDATQNAIKYLFNNYPVNEWVRVKGGLRYLAETYNTTDEAIKSSKLIATNGKRGINSRIMLKSAQSKYKQVAHIEPNPCKSEQRKISILWGLFQITY
jgi:hypothetical protein